MSNWGGCDMKANWVGLSATKCKWLSGFILAFAAVTPASGGTVQLTAHAHDSTGELNVPKTVTHPTLAIADTGNVNKPGAHARSWGAAIVSGGTLRKSTGGEGWLINGNSPKHQYWYANAGTGEFIIEDQQADVAELLLVIRRTGDVVDPAQPTEAPPEIGVYPSQGIFAEHDLSVQILLDANVLQGGEPINLFNGRAVLRGAENPNPGLTMTGDFDGLGVFTETVLNGNPGQVRLGAIVEQEALSRKTASVVIGTPFTLNLDLIMSQYEIDSLPFEPPLVDTGGILAASSGDLVVEVLARDGAGRPLEITAVVPEPGSLGLAMSAALGAIVLFRRRVGR